MQEETADVFLQPCLGSRTVGWAKVGCDLMGLLLKAVQGWGRSVTHLAAEDTEGPKGFMDILHAVVHGRTFRTSSSASSWRSLTSPSLRSSPGPEEWASL